jgi:hypothetical protein
MGLAEACNKERRDFPRPCKKEDFDNLRPGDLFSEMCHNWLGVVDIVHGRVKAIYRVGDSFHYRYYNNIYDFQKSFAYSGIAGWSKWHHGNRPETVKGYCERHDYKYSMGRDPTIEYDDNE